MPTKKPTKSSTTKSEKRSKPDLVCTTNTTPESVVDAKVAKQVSVTYRFFSAYYSGLIFKPQGEHVSSDSKKLTGLPVVLGYVVNDSIQSCTGSKIRRMPEPTQISIQPKGEDANPKKPRGAIKAQCHILPIKNVSTGKAFGLHLGSDTKEMFREYALYQITPDENDVVIDVYETYGKNDDDGTIEFVETKTEGGKEVDYYQALLTGDIWKKFSHTYDEDDVDSMMDVDLPKEAIAAVKRIYKGEVESKNGQITLDIAFDDKKTLRIKWGTDSENIRKNISNIDTRTEIINRVQPNTYGALIKAARDSAVDEIVITSGWRPMLGSMVHRMGLGLDVTYIKQAGDVYRMNRLWAPGQSNSNLTEEEEQAYQDVADKEKALAKAVKQKKTKEVKELKAQLKEAREKLSVEIKAAPEVTDPKPLADFRKTLLALRKVSQVLDPWYMDTNSADQVPPKENALASDLEKLHGHHLHITVRDSEIGG